MTPVVRNRLFALGTLIVVAYLAVMAYVCSDLRGRRLCNGIEIVVVDSLEQKFVTVAELRNELGRLPSIAEKTPLDRINTDSLQRMLSVIDKIENARVERLTNGVIRITVEPMRPVARVFDGSHSYYINKDGKKISAEARYFVDVPVIQGHFTDSAFTPLTLLPLMDYVASSERWSKVVSLIKADSPRDVLLIPAMKGLVFNLGEPADFTSKFDRFDRMVSEVIPRKGWGYYDTISVKWAGQIVATRADKIAHRTDSVVEEDDELVDVSTMIAGENIAPGQSLPGRKANSEKPVPGAKPVARKQERDSVAKKSESAPRKETKSDDAKASSGKKKDTPAKKEGGQNDKKKK